jgi:hypothetical protein
MHYEITVCAAFGDFDEVVDGEASRFPALTDIIPLATAPF